MRSPFLALLILPAMEIGLLALFASRYGLTAVALEVFGTSILGMYLLRRTGYRNLVEANARIQAAQESPEQVLGDLMKAIAGLMLIIPGIATDLVGLLLLLPPARRGLVRRWTASGQVFRYGASWHPQNQGRERPVGPGEDRPGAPGPRPASSGQDRHIIEGEFTRED